MEQASQKRYISPYYLAVVYSGLGRMDEAFRLLDQALEQRTPCWSIAARRTIPSLLPFGATRAGSLSSLGFGSRCGCLRVLPTRIHNTTGHLGVIEWTHREHFADF